MKKILKIFLKEDCRECNNVKLQVTKVLREPFINLDVEYIDVDIDTKQPTKFGVRSVPTVVLLRGDDILWRRVGPVTFHDLRYNVES